MIGISLRQLEVFVAVARSDSLARAAQALHLTQPAASMALAGLERQLGVRLFDRVRGRLHLNARGRALLAEAHEILARVGDLRGRAQGEDADLHGELRLGASNTVGNYLVGDLLGRFVARHPAVNVRLTVANTEAIVGGLLDYSLDIGCVEGEVLHAAIAVEAWRDDLLVVCARPDHALSRKRRLVAADFAGADWIVREPGSGTRAFGERMRAQLPAGRTVLELGQSEAIKQAVIAGLGIACLPRVAVEDALRAQRLRVLPTPFLDLQRKLSWVRRREGFRGALADALLADAAGRFRPPGAAPARRRSRGSGAAARPPSRRG